MTTETQEATDVVTGITNHATKSEKTAWVRQYNNLKKLVNKLQPVEDKILNLMAEKSKTVDELIAIRKLLVDTCIHPADTVVALEDGLGLCKFCEKRFKLTTPLTEVPDASEDI